MSRFVPASHQILVERNSLSGFSFKQLRLSISGTVRVIGSGPNVSVRLTSARQAQPLETTSNVDGAFKFDQLLPGKYRLTAVQDGWCWKNKNIDVELVDKDELNVSFEQTGYSLSIGSSHQVDLGYTINGEPSRELLQLKAGNSKHCLPQSGRYLFTAQSCHVFDPPSVEWNSDQPTPIHLKSVRHRIGLVVQSDHEIADLGVTASLANGQTIALTPESVDQRSGNEFHHRFALNAASGETLQVVAAADSLLFFPPTLSLTVGRDCDDQAGTIIAQRGLYVSGSVRPAIGEVQVTISGGRLDSPVTVETDASGRYSYGPVNLDGHPILDLAQTFRLEAKKKGYIVRESQDGFGNFIAEKLAEIVVSVTDRVTGQPLPSVMVAAAGGVGYRQNSQTGSDGRVTLGSLNPGEYFIKPVLKEYRFEPSSKLVSIEDGATVELEIK